MTIWPNRRGEVRAQVHRFHDFVALYVGTGETVYLTPAQARQLSRAINKAAKSCETETFAQSTCGTSEFEWKGNKQ